MIVNKELVVIATEKKKRNTVQKKVILDIMKQLGNHPTVDDVYVEVKKTYNNISKNTVYRNLLQLADDGEIRKVSLQGEPERYDNISKKHYHFKCNTCEMMSDVEMDYLEDINEIAKQKNEFQIIEHDIVFRGICSTCRKLADKSNDHTISD